MKASDFTKHMNRMLAVLKTAGNSEITNNLRELLRIFEGQDNKQVAAILKIAPQLNLNDKTKDTTVGTALPTLHALNKFLEKGATSSLKNDFIKFYKFLESYKSYSIKSLIIASKSALNKPKKTTSKRKKKLDKAEIDRIIQLLRDSIGDADTFAQNYQNLKIEDLQAVDVLKIAKNLDPSTPTKTSKKKALEKIRARHQDLVKYRKTSKSMSGRSAA